MRKKIKLLVLISFAGILNISCNSARQISLQIPVSPRYPISERIKSIAVLNRSINMNFIEVKAASPEYLEEQLRGPQVFNDSSASDSALISAAKSLFDSQRFDVVVPQEHNILRYDKDGMLSPLDSSFINGIRRDFTVDAVLVLENFSQRIFSSFELPWRRIIGNIELNSNLYWRLYQPGEEPLSITTIEKLYWIGGLDKSRREGYFQLPSLKQILHEGAIVSGWGIASQIGTIWENKKRYYYRTGNKDIDAAISLLKSDKWDFALETWLKYSTIPEPSRRSRIEYNLALASELTGNIDLAIEWANKSLETKKTSRTKEYIATLNSRKEAFKNLHGNE